MRITSTAFLALAASASVSSLSIRSVHFVKHAIVDRSALDKRSDTDNNTESSPSFTSIALDLTPQSKTNDGPQIPGFVYLGGTIVFISTAGGVAMVMERVRRSQTRRSGAGAPAVPDALPGVVATLGPDTALPLIMMFIWSLGSLYAEGGVERADDADPWAMWSLLGGAVAFWVWYTSVELLVRSMSFGHVTVIIVVAILFNMIAKNVAFIGERASTAACFITSLCLSSVVWIGGYGFVAGRAGAAGGTVGVALPALSSVVVGNAAAGVPAAASMAGGAGVGPGSGAAAAAGTAGAGQA